MKYLKATLLGSGALASLLLSSVLTGCQDEDFGYTSEEIRAAAYDRNFIAKYGEIDPDQNWDLSKYANNGNRSETRAAITGCTCPVNKIISGATTGWGADGRVETVDEWFFVEDQLVKEFNEKLPEQESDNQNQGTTGFHLQSNGVFYIIPMYQGQSGLGSDLHMVVTYGGVTYDNMIWSRSKDIYRQSEGSFEWKDLHNSHDYFKNVDWYADTQAGKYLASTRDAKGIKTKPIKCDIPYGAKIEFYLHINTGHVPYRSHDFDMDGITTGAKDQEAKLALTGDRMWDKDGKMIQLNSDGFHVTNADRYGKEFMIIACEDAWGKNDNHTATYTTDRNIDNKEITISPNEWDGDDDMNDLVFLFVSDDLPDVVEANQVRKRYIIEDLGSIVDWDFNDVVVDLAETTDPITNVTSQKAVLKHLCGTTPFELFIGPAGDVANSTKLNFSASNITYTDYKGESQTFNIVDGRIPGQQMAQNEELNIEFQLPSNCWNPSENNIWVKVYEVRDKYADRTDPNEGVNFGGNLDFDHNDNYTYGNGNSASNPGSGNGVINGEINNNFNLSNFQVVAFPRKGKVPRMIAVDTDYEWTEESHDITASLWTSYNITATATNTDGSGRGTVSGTGKYKGGRTVTLTATPEPGNIFVKWSNGSTERTITFTANENVSYTAEFKNVTDPKGFPINISTQFGQATVNIEQQLKDGYNTIKVYAANNANGSFGLKSNGNSTLDYIVAGDASDYKIVNGVGTVVLTEDQIKKIEDDSKTITVVSRSDNGITLNKVSLLNTQDYFTVELMPIDGQHGEITTADNDRFSGDWNADNTPYKNNGRRPFVKASYAAPTDIYDAPGCVLTANPDPGYKFVKWEQYDGSTLLNTDTRNPITVKNDVKLKAVFAELENYKVSAYSDPSVGGTVQIGNGQWGTNVSEDILEGTTIKLRAKANTNYEFVKWTGGQTTTEREVTVTKDMNPGAKFGKILLNSSQTIGYASGKNNDGTSWQNYTFDLKSYKSELSQNNTNTFIITMDSRVKKVRFLLGWNNELSSVNVNNGKCVVTFTNDQISSINNAGSFFMHVIDPETDSQNLQNANVTKIVCYKE